MARNMNISFLGTSSGGGPSISRNCSSLVADVMGDGSLWMVDCAEGTARQFQMQHRGQGDPVLKALKVTKLFVTHMHADHVMGIITFLRHVLHPPLIAPSGDLPPSDGPPQIELYGPAGLRTFVRSIFTMTLTHTGERYVVHELLTSSDTPTSCDPAVLHPSECPGQNFLCDDDGFWKGVTSGTGYYGEVVVDAGPILHRDPCIGFVFHEPNPPHRKLVILGDTYDASPIIPLIQSSTTTPVSLLIHEATDAYISRQIDPSARRTKDEVDSKVAARGHSTPVMAGTFAKQIGAQKVVLNHIGSRFPAPKQLKNPHDSRFAVIAEIERQASEAWGGGEAVVAYDFMRISIAADLNEEEFSGVAMELDDEIVLLGEVIEVGEIARGRGRGRGRGTPRGMSRGRWRSQWRGRGRGGGDADRGGFGRGGSDSDLGRGKKRRFGE
ncbi:beta-lactamase-like protein [Suillus subalutaceus]|uniref:beta-lactamase-like protein n=1 Tax=Suillus subalutaceus TaxID=48586 RepID=UPI001B867AAE|nr:beta-lactamase-like protein [Suillus subalutaceus]KAG1843572.1 beta-lactamase-like protein [Suillus subalutaceus]